MTITLRAQVEERVVAQEGLPQEIDVHVDPHPIPNPSEHVISSAKLTLNSAHRHNEPGLVGIDWPRDLIPQPQDFCARKLLQPGRAGLLSLEEGEYIRSRLEADAKLRRRWHIRRRKVPLSLVAERSYPEDPGAARRHMKAEQVRACRRMASVAKMSPAANTVSTKTGANMKETE